MQLKKVFGSLQRFILFLLDFTEKRFRLFSAKLRCFEHYVSKNSVFLFFVPKLHFVSQKAAI